MTELKYFGFFSELGLTSSDGTSISLKANTGAAPTSDTPQILGYLDEGWICMEVYDEQQTDAFSGEPIAPMKILTDGAWVWPNLVSHYITKHGLKVPEEFVERMRENGWHVPAVPDAQFDEIVETLIGPAADGAGLQDILDMLESEGGAS